MRSDLGYADYLGALQRCRLDAEIREGTERLLKMSAFLIDYPFADRLYPRVLEVVGRLSSFWPTVILSDGDVVFQPRKVRRWGLWDAVCTVLRPDPVFLRKATNIDLRAFLSSIKTKSS